MNQRSFQQAAQVVPRALRGPLMGLGEKEQARCEEIRLRVGQPVGVVYPEGERELTGERVTPEGLEQLVELATQASLHTALEPLRQGYLTVAGGHRVGVCGCADVRDGFLYGFRWLSSASVRIARAVTGPELALPGLVDDRGALHSTLILAPPGMGKTTLLRALIRQAADGVGMAPQRVGLADERGEVAALWRGEPQLPVGRLCDVVSDCPKGRGMLLLLRAMNPQILAADEITAPEDGQAMLWGAGCGVKLLTTAHGESRADLLRRPLYRPLLEAGLFRRLVTISRVGEERRYQVEELP